MKILFKIEDYESLGKRKISALKKHSLPSERLKDHWIMDRDLFYKIVNKPTYPPIVQQIINFISSLYLIFIYMLKRKGIFIDAIIYHKRLSICKKCIYFDKVNYRCGKCGCFSSVKNIFRSQKCPMGNW